MSSPRNKFLLGAGIIIASVIFLIASGVKETGVYFLTPSGQTSALAMMTSSCLLTFPFESNTKPVET